MTRAAGAAESLRRALSRRPPPQWTRTSSNTISAPRPTPDRRRPTIPNNLLNSNGRVAVAPAPVICTAAAPQGLPAANLPLLVIK